MDHTDSATHSDVTAAVRAALHRGADDLHLFGSGPSEVMRRARRQQQRNRATIATVAAAVVGGSAWAVIALDSDTGSLSTEVADEGTGVPAAPVADVPTLSWSAAEGTVVFPQTSFVGSDGAYYALSTAPGVADPGDPSAHVAGTLYRSTDGITWQNIDVGADPWIADLGERGGALYALGTAPAVDGVSAQIGVSRDGGTTWDRHDLPTTAAPPPSSAVHVGPTWVDTNLAVGNDLMLASVRTRYGLDTSVLLTDEDGPDAFVEIRPDSVAVMAQVAGCEPAGEGAGAPPTPEPEEGASCGASVVRTITWNEVGLDGAEDLYVNELFVSTDGSEWSPVDAPFTGYDEVDISATPDGFIATTWRTDETGNYVAAAFRSTDATAWTSIAPPVATAAEFHAVGQRLIATELEGVPRVHTSLDAGQTWTTADLASLLPDLGAQTMVSIHSAEAGPLGIALVVLVWDELYEVRDVSDSATPATTIAPQPAPFGDPQSFLAYSPDGVSWSLTAVSDLEAATGVDIATLDWILVADSQLVVTGSIADDDPTAGNLYSLVGTPIR